MKDVYNVKVAFLETVPLDLLQDCIACKSQDQTDYKTVLPKAIQAFNIIMAAHPNKDAEIFMGSHNTKFFRFNYTPKEVMNYSLTRGVVGIRGFSLSVRPSLRRILLNLNTQCSPLYPTINVIRLKELFEKAGGEDTSRFLDKLRVKTIHSGKEIVYTIQALETHSHAKKIGFKQKIYNENSDRQGSNQKDTGGECVERDTNVFEYFQEKGIRLEYPKFILKCGSREKPSYVPAELCEIMPGQAYHYDLEPSQTTRMMHIAAQDPAVNASRIIDNDGGLDVIGIAPTSTNPTLEAFGVNVDPNMVVVSARILSPPPVTYCDSTDNLIVKTPTLASWNLGHYVRGVKQTLKFTDPGQVPKWAALHCCNNELDDSVFEKLERALIAYGLTGPNSMADEFRVRDDDHRWAVTLDNHFMHVPFTILLCLAYASLISATSPCKQQPSGSTPAPSTLAITAPLLHDNVVIGKPYTITWDKPPDINTISIVLLQGPSSNVVPIRCIVENAPNSGSFIWTPSATLKESLNSGYGLQIIALGSGKFQWSAQFGIQGPQVLSSTSLTTAPDIHSSSRMTTMLSAKSTNSANAQVSARSSSTLTAQASILRVLSGSQPAARLVTAEASTMPNIIQENANGQLQANRDVSQPIATMTSVTAQPTANLSIVHHGVNDQVQVSRDLTQSTTMIAAVSANSSTSLSIARVGMAGQVSVSEVFGQPVTMVSAQPVAAVTPLPTSVVMASAVISTVSAGVPTSYKWVLDP